MKRINLLRQDGRGVANAGSAGVRDRRLAVACVLAVAAWLVVGVIHVGSLDAEIASRRSTVAELRQSSKRAERLRKERSELSAERDWLDGVSGGVPGVMSLAALSRALPGEVGLTRFALSRAADFGSDRTRGGATARASSDYEMRIEGIAADNVELTAMVQGLTREPTFRQVRLIESGSSERASGGGRRFVVTGVVTPVTIAAEGGDR